MIEILPSVTPFSEQRSTTVPGQLPMAQTHERDSVKGSIPRIKGLLGFFKPSFHAPQYTTRHSGEKLKTQVVVPG